MAAGMIQWPGSEFGPCLGECSHRDCVALRALAKRSCHRCGNLIGYGTRFYVEKDGTVVHALCEERAIEEENKSRDGQ